MIVGAQSSGLSHHKPWFVLRLMQQKQSVRIFHSSIVVLLFFCNFRLSGLNLVFCQASVLRPHSHTNVIYCKQKFIACLHDSYDLTDRVLISLASLCLRVS